MSKINSFQDRYPTNLKEEIIRLGPWHLDVQVTSEIGTAVFLDAPADRYSASMGKPSFINPRQQFISLMKQVYPEGLKGKRFLDSACNCGGYCFWAKELAASECFGFDVRPHWIEQAQFLLQHRVGPKDGLQFQVCDLYDLPKLGLKPFDITLFKGIFYHLPDPVSGLKIVADLTSELLYLDTATRNDLPDGCLAVGSESTTALMSGAHGLNWLPTGPKVLEEILTWMGFVEFRLLYWRKQTDQKSNQGRLGLLAARQKGLFDNFDQRRQTSYPNPS